MVDDASDNGYLSDVPTQNSNCLSEFNLEPSTDLIHFQDKYSKLKEIYEQRIMELSEAVRELCSKLIDDDFVSELKSDGLTKDFIPSYLADIFASHLEAEREKHAHLNIARIAQLEIENGEMGRVLSRQMSKLQIIELEAKKGRRSEIEIEKLRSTLETVRQTLGDRLKSMADEIDDLQRDKYELESRVASLSSDLLNAESSLGARDRQITALTTSNGNSDKKILDLEKTLSRFEFQLSLQGQSDSKSRVIEDKFSQLRDQCDSLRIELSEAQSQLKSAAEREQRLGASAQSQVALETKFNEKVAFLMSEVETLLSKETNESNAALATMHEKMRSLQRKLSNDIESEKKVSQALRDENVTLRLRAEDNERRLEQATAECAHAKGALSKTLGRLSLSEAEIEKLRYLFLESKAESAEFEARYRLTADRVNMLTDDHKRQQSEGCSTAVELSDENALEKAGALHRLKYHNELRQLQSQLRHSYAFGTSVNDVAADMLLKEEKMKVLQERKEKDLDSYSQSGAKSRMISSLHARLKEAAGHIDKLGSIVRQHRGTISNHERTIVKLENQLSSSGNNSSLAWYVPADGSNSRGDMNAHVLQAEVKRLQSQLIECQTQAGKELLNMKKRFDKLMQSYQMAVSTKNILGVAGATGGAPHSDLDDPVSSPVLMATDRQAAFNRAKEHSSLLQSGLAIRRLRRDLSTIKESVATSWAVASTDISAFVKELAARHIRTRAVLDEVIDAVVSQGLLSTGTAVAIKSLGQGRSFNEFGSSVVSAKTLVLEDLAQRLSRAADQSDRSANESLAYNKEQGLDMRVDLSADRSLAGSHSEELLLELSRLERDSRIADLVAQISSLEVSHEHAIAAVKAENVRLEQTIKAISVIKDKT